MIANAPKYIKISEYIKQEIKEGHYKPGDRLPSESMLMEMFSVSRIVVINALKELSGEGIIYRLAGKGSYVSDRENDAKETPEPSSLAGFKHVSLIIPVMDDYYSITLVFAMLQTLYERKIHCSVHYSFNSSEKEAELVDYAVESGQDGIILFPCDKDIYTPSLLNAIEKNFPIVLLDHDLPGLGLNCVTTDNKEAIRLAIRHLVKLGHQKICLFSRVPMPTASITERINGYLFEMKAQNKLIDPSLILTDNSEKALVRELENVISRRLATAIICLSLADYNILLQMMKQYGCRCPEDFSVIHFDNNNKYTVDQPTTHIVQDSKSMAENTARILERIFSGTNIYEKILIAPLFVEGFSTSIPRNE